MPRRRGRPTARQIGRSQLRAGVIGLLVLLPLLYMGFTKSIPFRSHYEIEAVFSSAATEIKAGSPVRIAGVNVGKVSAVERGPGATALVRMRLEDKARPVRTDAIMKIRPRLFLEGNFFVDVQPGRPGAPELAADGRIPLAQTAIPVQFDQLLATFDKPVRADLQTTFREFSSALRPAGRNGLRVAARRSPKALLGLARTSSALRGLEQDDLRRLVTNVAAASNAIAGRPEELRGLLRGLDGSIGALASRSEAITTSLDLLDPLLASAPRLKAQTLPTTAAVRTLAGALDPALRVAPAELNRANRLLRSAQPLLSDGRLPRLAATLRPAARDLSAQIPDLTRTAATAQPILQCIDEKLVPVLNAKLDDGQLTNGLTVTQELARFGVGLSGASADFNGNGHSLRLGLGGSEQTLGLRLPGVQQLTMLSEQPILGASPRYTPGRETPFRPDADCRTQPLPDLAAKAAPAPSGERFSMKPVVPTTTNALEQTLGRLRAQLRRGAKR